MIKTKGIVAAVTPFGENDKILSVLTDKLGMVSVSAKGATSRHNNLKAATRMFCYGDFVLYSKKNNFYTISEVSPITDFMGLSRDIDRLNAAAGIMKFVKFSAVENQESEELLRLVLNSLHMLANTEKNINIISVVFYSKALEYMGLPPVTEECALCGRKDELLFFAPYEGGCVCGECGDKMDNRIRISDNAVKIMDYILKVPLESAFGIETAEDFSKEVLQAISLFLKVHLSYNL